MATKTKRAVGRPSEYTQELADRICDLLSEGLSLRSVCTDESLPDKSTVFRWIRTHEEFRNQYARAKQESADAMAEDTLDIADDGTNDFMTITKGDHEYEVVNQEAINRSRLRVETRKWLMAKMKPKQYGDKVDITSGGEKLTPIFGGTSAVQTDNSDQESIQSQESD